MTNRPSQIDLAARASAVLAAALDGHNPRIQRHPDGKVTLRPGHEPSDLDLSIGMLMAVPVNEHHQIRAVALQAIEVIQWLAFRHDIDRDELIETLRRNTYGHIRAAEEAKDGKQ